MPVSSDAKWSVQTSRGAQHRTKDSRRYRTHPASRNEARDVLEAGQSRTGALSESLAALPGDAESDQAVPALTPSALTSLRDGTRIHVTGSNLLRRLALQLVKALLVISVMLWFSTTTSFAGEIDACKYLIVTDFTQDPYGIAKELRAQGRARGFVVVSTMTEVPPG